MSEANAKIKEATKDICSLYDRVVSGLSANMEKLDTHEVYEIADVIKDLAEAKKYLCECVYKEQLLEAMEEADYGEDYDENGRMGYRGRGANGRFVHRSGRGRSAGYTPEEFLNEPRYYPNYPIMNNGYTPSGGGSMGGSGGSQSGGNGNTSGGYTPSDKGETYDTYRRTRRYYTETHTDEEKHKMKEAIKDNFNNIKAMTVEMWEDLDQAEKDKYRKELMDVMK